MNGTLVAVNAVVSFAILPLVLVAVFKRNWKHAKYLWLAVAVLGTASLAMELYTGADAFQYILAVIIVVFALLDVRALFKSGAKT